MQVLTINSEEKRANKTYCMLRPGSIFQWIISNLVEGETGFLSEKGVFSVGPANREDSLWPKGPLPGQKSIRLAKKGGGPSFADAGFRRFSPPIPFPPASLCGYKEKGTGKVSPGPFCLRRLLSCPGNKETGLNDQRNWR